MNHNLALRISGWFLSGLSRTGLGIAGLGMACLCLAVVAWSSISVSMEDSGVDRSASASGLRLHQSAWSLTLDDQTEGKSDTQSGEQSKRSSETSGEGAGKKTTTAEGANGKKQKMEQATFGGGCFWCVEAVLQRVDGVESVVSGYAGGTIKMPTYEQVCTGRTGHAEVVQVTYDPAKVSFTRLLEIFMKTHDPTTLNRQGHDVGTQYRSIILTHNEEQARQAEEMKKKLDEAKVFEDPIVTAIEPLKEFYPAEKDHQDYYNRNPNNRYCQIVVRSKVEKLEKFFKQYMKDEAK